MEQHSFSPQLTPLIGRQAEATDIRTMLTETSCRLLTLVGPGGIGKTTLAVHAADRLLDDFRHGVVFVPLQPIQTSEFVATAVADALGFSLAGPQEPLVQVCHYLRDKELLLVLDNFEHLLAELDTLTVILQSAPTLKVLVTSREALNLRDEWLYLVSGLGYPQAAETQALSDYPAIQLFVDRACRVRNDFSLASEYPGIVRICQLVEGMPLALELAASWAKALRCEDIATEIEHNLDFLSTRLRDLPRRHHSMRAVFEHSWALLTDDEQTVFRRLCVFRSGFTHQAAAQVARASLAPLLSLVDKSLVRWLADDRYQIHELLRQYAQEKLEETPSDVVRTRDAHCIYYADFLYARERDMTRRRQLEAAAEIEVELDNVRAAWHWALETYKVTEIVRSLQTLGRFDQFRSRYREGAAMFEQAVRALERESPTSEQQTALILLLVYLGWLYIRLGQLEQAQAALLRCQALYAALDLLPLPGISTDPDTALSIVALNKGDYTSATELGEIARQRNTAAGQQYNLQLAHYVLSSAARAKGEYGTARHHARHVYKLSQEMGDRWFMAYCRNELGQVEQALGNYVAAEQHFRTSFQIRLEFKDSEGMAVALRHMGQIAMLQADCIEARRLFAQSRALYEEINDRGGLASALEGLGAATGALGDYVTARQHFHRALQLAVEIEFVPLMFSLFIHVGEFFIQTGNATWGINLLVLTYHHPASSHATKDRAAQLLAHYRPTPTLDLRARVSPSDKKDALEELAAQLLTELALSAGLHDSEPAARGPLLLPAQPSLVEQLTQRELELLRLLAQGLSNQDIAETLIVSVGTVKAHNHSIFAKLGVNNRTQAVMRAQELHLI
jgi:predicted ATPase/DNA-binding CsgD family transcriptional regulator